MPCNSIIGQSAHEAYLDVCKLQVMLCCRYIQVALYFVTEMRERWAHQFQEHAHAQNTSDDFHAPTQPYTRQVKNMGNGGQTTKVVRQHLVTYTPVIGKMLHTPAVQTPQPAGAWHPGGACRPKDSTGGKQIQTRPEGKCKRRRRKGENFPSIFSFHHFYFSLVLPLSCY